MPGYILHLAAARMYLNTLPEDAPLSRRPDMQNDFYVGNLLPDAVDDKTASHFRAPAYQDYMVIWPRPEEFRLKYRKYMNDPMYLGYYFHLYIDRKFFSEYLPEVVEFLNSDGQPASLRQDVHAVRLKRDGGQITLDQYLSEDYYYGDYTKMTTWLCERYHLPEDLYVSRDPGIKEVDITKLDSVFKQLKTYRNVPADAVHDVRIFDPDSLTGFLEKVSHA